MSALTSNFNIVSMEIQTLMGLNINVCVAIDTMLKFEGDANLENGLNVYVAIATQALTSSVNGP